MNTFDKLIKEINEEYLEILNESLNLLNTDFKVDLIVDSICSFWKRKERKVFFLFNYTIKKYNTVLFSSEYYNNDNHIYTCKCLSDKIIYDETITTKINYLNDKIISNESFRSLIIKEIKDEISLINKFQENIFIVPTRFICNNNIQGICKMADFYFLSLFNNKYNNVVDYLKNINSYEDLMKNIDKEYLKRLIIVPQNNKAIKENVEDVYKSYQFDENKSFGYKFYICYISVIRQAIDIFYTNYELQTIPYFSYEVRLINFYAIAFNEFENRKDNKIKIMINKSILLFCLYEEIKNLNVTMPIENDLDSFINKYCINRKDFIDFEFKEIREMVKSYIDKFKKKD